MYVCLCHAVTDQEVKAAIHAGAGCAESVGEMTCAGTCCGCCKGMIEAMVDEHIANQAPTRLSGRLFPALTARLADPDPHPHARPASA